MSDIRAEVSRVTAAKRATAKRLSLDSVAMRLAKAESMPGRNGRTFYSQLKSGHVLKEIS